MKNELIMMHGTSYKEMVKAICSYAALVDEIQNPQAYIGFKPNLVLDASPSLGATTHPELIAGAIEYFHEHGYFNLAIMESSWIGAKTMKAYHKAGYDELTKRYHVPFIDLQKDSWHVYDASGVAIKVCDEAKKVDYMINFPVFKGHCQTRITCALKNNKGLIPNVEKRRFHTMGLHKPIAHLNLVVPHDFIIVDNICGDLDFEEGGSPVTMNRVIGAFDPVLCDAFVCESMGYSVDEVPYIRIAEQLGIGSADTSKVKIIRLNEPVSDHVPSSNRRVRALSRKVADKDACSACYGSLIHALHRLDDDRILKGQQIAIGQGYQGQTGEVGVGNCTRCFKHYVPGCPPKAQDIMRFLKEEFIHD